MEAAVEKLETSYRGQMNGWFKMLYEQVEGGLCIKVEGELTGKLLSEIQEQLKGETNQVGRAISTRVGTASV